jgi:spoIIIJ-associated protein
MTAFERRIVHVALQEYPDITTESQGEGPTRRVVIRPYP